MDLDLGQAGWDKIFQRWGLLIRIWVWLKEYVQSKMVQDRDAGVGPYSFPYEIATQDWNEDGPTLILKPRRYSVTTATLPHVYNFILNGIKIGINTDLMGILFAKITMNAGNTSATVSLYKDSDETALVAEGSGIPGSITLSEQNGSGITGQCYFESVFGSDKIEDYILAMRLDWKKRFQQEFGAEGSKDIKMLSTFLERLSVNTETLKSMVLDWQDLIESEFINSYLKSEMQSSAGEVLSVSHSQNEGVVSIEYSGLLKELADNMADDTVPQTVRKNSGAASAVTPDPDNVGQGTVEVSLFEHARPGKVILTCENNVLGSEYFEVRFSPYAWWDFEDLIGSYYAYVKKIYRDNSIGIASLLISRTIVETGDTANKYSGWSFNGESSENTDNGKLYIKYFATGQIHKVFKSTDDRDQNINEVCAGTGISGTVTLEEQNGSELTGSVVVASEPDDAYKVDLDLQVFQEGDIFTFTITKTETGLIQKYLNDVYNYSLPSASVLGDETVKDYFARRG